MGGVTPPGKGGRVCKPSGKQYTPSKRFQIGPDGYEQARAFVEGHLQERCTGFTGVSVKIKGKVDPDSPEKNRSFSFTTSVSGSVSPEEKANLERVVKAIMNKVKLEGWASRPSELSFEFSVKP
jgi:hypothetical protein